MTTSGDDMLLIPAADAADLLSGQEAALMGVVAAAYAAHGRGESVVPHSSFLRLPKGRDRIIALPAYLGGTRPLAGMKWIASFPDNVDRGRERASGLVVLNSLETGRPLAIVDGGVVSATRTAASAAIAARMLHVAGGGVPPTVGLVGCGAIGFATLRFLGAVWPELTRVVITDVAPARAGAFAERVCAALPAVEVETADGWSEVFARADVVVVATTAMTPYIDELAGPVLRTVLHLALRDLSPSVILGADNVVDDVDHVCRADTSLDLAARLCGSRGFIRGTIADVLAGFSAPKRDDSPTIFSPFGLGILDIAVARFICERAEACGRGSRIPWATRAG